MKKIVSIMLASIMLLIATAGSVSAFTPPGLAKKGGLPPGIPKRFIGEGEKSKEYTTTIFSIDYTSRRITIQDGTALISLLVSEKAKVEINGNGSTFNALEKDDEVTLKLDENNTVVEIKCKKVNSAPIISVVEGNIAAINKTTREVTIVQNSRNEKYILEKDTVITIDGITKTINDLVINMEVKITLQDQKVKTLEALSQMTKITGKIQSIDYRNLEVVVESGSQVRLYKVKTTTPVYIDQVKRDFTQLVVGMEVEVKLTADKVTEIRVYQEVVTYEGRLVAKDTGTEPSITIQIGGENRVLKVKKDIDLSRIAVGKQVIVYVKNNEVIAIGEK